MRIEDAIAKLHVDKNNNRIDHNKEYVIFGNGVNGDWVYEQLAREQCCIRAILDDKHLEQTRDVAVVNREQLANLQLDYCNTIVVVSFFVKSREKYRQIKDSLAKLGFLEEQIVNYIEILMEDYFEKRDFIKEAEQLGRAYDGLADAESRELLEKFVEAVTLGNAGKMQEESDREQYFDETVLPADWKERAGYFLDCGAYIGDTYDVFQRQNTQMNYAGFEPDIHNYALLAQHVREYGSANKEHLLFPCATGKEDRLVSFQYSERKTDSPGSSIQEHGNSTIPVVAIDDVVHGSPVAFLKMDVEGAEYDSLLGAELTIKTQRPILAICTYHSTRDMWRLQELIESFDCNYEFYLRSYYMYSRETVLYAVPK